MTRFIRFSHFARIIFFAAFAMSNVSAAPVLQIAAASDLACCIEALNRAFEKTVQVSVRASIGSSGNFYAQIRNGAPFDVFLSADLDYPERLGNDGYADRSSLTVYAIGALTMLVSDRRFASNQGWAVLTDPAVMRIAIANPDVAPYGRAAKAALVRAGLWDQVQSKLVKGENVAQTAQFVRSGNAQVGLIGASHVQRGQLVWLVPQEMYPPIEQGAIVTAKGARQPLARQYLAFLHSEAARAILRDHGFRFSAAAK